MPEASVFIYQVFIFVSSLKKNSFRGNFSRVNTTALLFRSEYIQSYNQKPKIEVEGARPCLNHPIPWGIDFLPLEKSNGTNGKTREMEKR